MPTKKVPPQFAKKGAAKKEAPAKGGKGKYCPDCGKPTDKCKC